MRFLFLIIFIFTDSVAVVLGQSTAYFDLDFYNLSYINPAYVGTEANQKFVGSLRRTVPSSGNLANTTGLLGYERNIEAIKSGIGIVITNERSGPRDEVRYNLMYSYKIVLKDSSQLRVGTNLSLNKFVVDPLLSQSNYTDPTQIPIYQNIKPRLNFGVGIWYSRTHLVAGISADYLNRNGDSGYSYNNYIIIPFTTRRYQVLIGGQNLNVTKNLSSNPAIICRTDFSNYVVDVLSNIEYKKTILLGVRFTTVDVKNLHIYPLTLQGGIRFLKNYQVLFNINSNTHTHDGLNGELMVKVNL